MSLKNKLLAPTEASEKFELLGKEFALIPNPSFVHPSYELTPLAPKITVPSDQMVALVMDMDGTTTTTEELCIHSLEHMVRKITGRFRPGDWAGLDHVADYPHIIGNSTTKHVEYLIRRYGADIRPEALRDSYFFSAVWTLANGQDLQRVQEMKLNLTNLGCGALLHDDECRTVWGKGNVDEAYLTAMTQSMLKKYGNDFRAPSENDVVRAAIDIYYQRYHYILMEITRGASKHLSKTLLGSEDRHLIEPMPGIGIVLALSKGWLEGEIEKLWEMLLVEYKRKCGDEFPAIMLQNARDRVCALGHLFRHTPLKLAVVTSSIYYEANIVMQEVFRQISLQIGAWPIRPEKKEFLKDKFADYRNVYDAFVTASDSSEIRLKPHRDLYSIALHQLGIPRDQFDRVAGFEDSESGTIAIRAAGIGLCVAVPFAKTSGHDLGAAAFVLPGGMPEALLRYNMFIQTP